MTTMAVHLRIASLQVTNEEVDSRKAAATTLSKKWGKLKQTNAIAQKSTEIAEALSADNGNAPLSIVTEVEAAIQETASAFLASEAPLEVGICAGMAMVELLEGGGSTGTWSATDVYSACLWSALGFQQPLNEPKREALREQVLLAAQRRCVTFSEAARERTPVPDIADVQLTPGEEIKAIPNLRKAVVATVTALKRNASLDREELDFLWWSRAGDSRILKRPLIAIDESVRTVVLGIEAANYLRRLPTDVHRDVVLRLVEVDAETTLEELLALMGSDRELLAKALSDSSALTHPKIFPLLCALASAKADVPGASNKRTSSEWGERALLEAGLAQMLKTSGVGAT